MANSLPSNSASTNKNPQDPASHSMQSQVGNQGQQLPMQMGNNQVQARQQLYPRTFRITLQQRQMQGRQQTVLPQQPQQQQRQVRVDFLSLQQQLLRKPEGNDAILAFQAGGLHGALGGSNFASSSGAIQMSQQSRKFIELAQQHSGAHIREEAQNRGQGIEQHVLNPLHQAYLQYAFQAAQQKSGPGMQSQQQTKMGMLGPPPAKEQDSRLGNLKMQELISIQAANQAHASSSKKPLEHFARPEKQTDQLQHVVSEQRSDMKPPIHQPMPQLMQGNVVRPLQAPQAQQSIQNMADNQVAVAAQMQAMQALALEHNIDLSSPANVNLMAQLIPLMQSRMLAQQKSNESNMGSKSSPASMPKQQATSPPAASESSPHGNSPNNVSGHSGPAKPKQTVPLGHFGMTQNIASVNSVNSSNSIPAQQFLHMSRQSPHAVCCMLLL